mgnify:CR=1 FL=1|tara:strand:+ start:458 stop:865 length:408 start_codon:yes stop_codon:yes gene_type:complete
MNRDKEHQSYYRWKHRVDHHIRYLIGQDSNHLDNFLYRDYYDNDFSPKVVAFLAVKNGWMLHDTFNDIEVWRRELFKCLNLFYNEDESLMLIDRKQILSLFHQSLDPLLVAESILQNNGLLPQPKFEYGISPPKF